jgi:uncharacterized protein involved in cysteine biosynthesis
MVGDFARGARCALRGFALVRVRGVWPWAITPLAINAIVFGAAITLGGAAFGDFIDGLLPQWLDLAIVHILLWLIFAVAMAVMAFYAFTLDGADIRLGGPGDTPQPGTGARER